MATALASRSAAAPASSGTTTIDEYDGYPDVATVTTGDRIVGIDLREPDFVDTTGAGVTTTVGSLAGDHGPVPRGRHAPQADRGRHDGRGRLGPAADATRSRPATRSTGIASKFDVSMMTLWWANDLDVQGRAAPGPDPDDPAGQRASCVTVTANDTLDAIAAKYKVDKDDASSRPTTSTDPNLVVGQVLVVPGAKGKPIPTPEARQASGHQQAAQLGRRRWPVARRPRTPAGGSRGRSSGGGNYISQYYHYGHYGIDIAADYGSRVRAARRRDGHLRRLEEQRRRLPGLDRPRLRAVHDLQPHVGGHRRTRPARRARPAGRPGRPVRQRDGPAPPLRGLARPRLGRRQRGSTRWATSRPIAAHRPPAGAGEPRARMPAMFLDRVKIWVRAGDGGDGAATFRREAHVPRGGPDGGDGGRGGSVYLAVDAGQTTLRDFQAKRHFKATSGGRGEGSRRHGKAGDDLVLSVPPGTARLRRRDRRAPRRPRRASASGRWSPAAAAAASATRTSRPRPTRRREHAQKGEPGDGALAPARAAAHRRHRARRAAERRQVDAAGGPHRRPAEDRRLPVHDARAEPRRHGPRRRGRAPTDDRRRARAHRGRERRRRPRPRVPAPRRADADPRPRRRRVVARPGVGPRGHPRRAAGPRPGAAREADARRVQQDRPARGRATRGPASARPREGGPDGRRHLRGRPARVSTRSAPSSRTCCRTPPSWPARPSRPASSSTASRRCSDGFVVEPRRPASIRVRGTRIERIAAQTNFDVEESAERFQRDLARLGIDAELRRAGIAPGDLVRIGATELEWEAQPWEGR